MFSIMRVSPKFFSTKSGPRVLAVVKKVSLLIMFSTASAKLEG